MPGLFVTFEGGDGSGKSTQIARLAERLRRLGHDPVMAREPGGTPLAEGIRSLLLDPGRTVPALTEAFLIQAARAEVMRRVIVPALYDGRVVLCDRHTDSTLAYQGYGRRLDLRQLRSWNRAATSGLVPDLTFLFDLDPSQALARRAMAGAKNRLDAEPLEFHVRVREGFLALAQAEPGRFVVLDATLDPETLEAQVGKALEPHLERLSGLTGGAKPTRP
jgi:dTMP kinase